VQSRAKDFSACIEEQTRPHFLLTLEGLRLLVNFVELKLLPNPALAVHNIKQDPKIQGSNNSKIKNGRQQEGEYE
jgi:hypothetical protein